MRTSARRLALYSHKGGVGKTTLTAAIGASLASSGKRVLLIDSDPQTNLSASLLDESHLDELLDSSDTESGQTIWSAVRPVALGEGKFRSVVPLKTPVERLSLVPGDIKMADFEETLGNFWSQCFQRKILAYKVTAALSAYVNEISADFDFVLFDTGPNIGPLNRIILLDCDGFIIPVAPDLFSKRALKTLGRKIYEWVVDWQQVMEMAPQDLYLMPGKPHFLGYIPQRFKLYRNRLSNPAIKGLADIEKALFNDVVQIVRTADRDLAEETSSGLRLGEVKDYSALVAESQATGFPLSVLGSGPADARAEALEAFHKIAANIISKFD